jgi:hypothetical protein
VNTTVLLCWIDAVPVPDSSDRNSGAGAVADVLLVTVAGVVAVVYRNAAGSCHSAVAVFPLKPVPVNWIVVSGHPLFGVTDVRCHADAAWALPSSTTSASVAVNRAHRPCNRRLGTRAAALLACTASLR